MAIARNIANAATVTRLLFSVALCLGAGSFVSSHANEATAIVDMRGFKVDFALATESQKTKVQRSLDKQLEIVEAADLPETVMSFFRTVPIVVDPALTKMNGEYMQLDGRWVVRVKPTSLPKNRAIVLHELLHAYQHQVLKPPVPAIGRAYQEALRPNTYPAKFRGAYFLSNAREFFAVAGEVYLFGSTERPPFDCSTVRKAQPEFIAYLAQLFGERACR